MPSTTTAVRSRPRTNGAPDHTDFLRRVASKEADSRVTKRPAPLSARQHAAHRKQLKQVQYIKPKYAIETEINVTGIFGKWKRYCTEMAVGDWKLTIESLDRETLMDFFLFVCENYRIKSRGSSQEYIRQFSQLHTTSTGRYVDRNHMKELYKESLLICSQYHDRVLVPRFGLRPPNIDGKPVLNVDSLRVILVYNIAYDTSIFPLELHRLNLSNCYQILCYTGARPAELVDNERKKPKDGSLEELFGTKAVMSAERPGGEVEEEEDEDEDDSSEVGKLLLRETIGRDRPKALCYEDILLMIVRHPVTGRAVPAMSIKFVHHKGCDNKPKPTIFFFTASKTLLFCPLLLMISLAILDDAFEADCLIDARSVLGVQVPRGMKCLPLRWKESKLKIPVFRHIHRGTVSRDVAMSYDKLRHDMGNQSLNAGFEKRWTLRFARRGAANAANGNAPDPVRDQMMRHNPEFYTFQDAYLNQIANFDLQNAFLEEETEDQLFRLFAHVSLTRDPRAKKDMVPDEVWANLEPDPDIVTLETEREKLKSGQYRIQGNKNEAKIRELTNQIRTKRAQREDRIVKEYREYYFYNRPTWDLERQARGEDMEEYAEPAIDLVIPERTQLAKLLCYQPKKLSDEEMLQRRIEAVDLYVALGGKRETVKRNRTRPRSQIELPIRTGPTKVKTALKPEPEPELEPELDPFPLLMQPTQCPDCIGDAAQTIYERTFSYCRSTKRNDHFDDHHLDGKERAEQQGEPIACKHPKCSEVKLRSVYAFRNHVQSIHGVALRSSAQVQKMRTRKVELKRVRRTG
ncbi:FluG domain-containing protein [Pseudomassariella vexata]|uniref:FluG domain-containing protein n=1 Tax=Pseudomassariella vexata TaxID=1141098 RepID=A0A1Y2EAV5_9PEZI|nr:FluG domain-containing protein [Pseudomassariella vexata]ORY68698.1 FluG domain-containing protein [Pseudomassariella vexata]